MGDLFLFPHKEPYRVWFENPETGIGHSAETPSIKAGLPPDFSILIAGKQKMNYFGFDLAEQ